MTTVHSTTVIFFYVQLISAVTSQACTSGYFGTGCKYKCRCTSDMCDNNGSCLGADTCKGGWFGPACQYADIAYGKPAVNYLTDGDDGTCRDYTGGSNSVTLNLTDSYPFTWLRVHVNRTEAVSSLQVTFNYTVSCNNPRNATVDNQTWDIYCSIDEFVKSVTLAGPAASSLCSIYISGGRDIAIKETAQQSSTYDRYPASLSVDGNITANFGGGTCSATDAQPGQSTPDSWNVTFSQARSVNRYAIYNRADSATSRLRGFLLESFNGGTLVSSYTNSKGILPVYTVKHGHLQMSFVQITSGSSDKVLQMCEMEIYGDSICGDGQYGRECENTCNCDGGNPCFVSTGGCPSGCAIGHQGENCSIPCEPGKYGAGCLTNCSQFCGGDTKGVRSCDRVNGTCDLGCEAGYRESDCTLMCEREHYGPQCNNTCSDHCANQTMAETSCDHVNGTCRYGCQAGYKEPLCLTSCEAGKYGPGCGYNCSSICVVSNTTDQSPCHHVTGFCMFGCLGGNDVQICKQESGNPAGPGNGEVIGIIVGCVLGVILLAVIIVAVVFILRRKKRGKPQTDNSQLAVTGSNYSLPGDGVRQAPPGKTTGKTGADGQKVDNTSTPSIYYNTLAGDHKSTVVQVNELAGLMTSKDKDFFKNQFSAIPANETATMNVGLSSENKHKNRYKNVCAYDHSRVHLKPNAAKKHGDYINASYIEGYKPDEKFIASQGPTKIILEDFVRMLWEQQVEKVVMLTNLVEEGKTKCERYWPEDGEIKVGEITVLLTTTEVFADYTIHRLQLKKDGNLTQDLTHFHFTSWPDKDVPNTPWGLVDFEQRVASYPTNKPIVVHCSAGVGRTGTFIALRNVMREAEETGHVDFFTAVRKLRQDRINMVQTADQYIFLHNAALVAILCIGTTVTSMDIENRVTVLETKLQSGQTRMEAEFRSVCTACDDKNEEKLSEDNPYNVYENSQNIVNKQKNRVESILPKEMYRAKLRCENNDTADYINAVLIPSFSKQNQQILTQLPLPSTVTDFWRLVTQYKVTVIVAFQADMKSTDPTIAAYLPLGESETHNNLPMFQISTKSAQNAMFWRQQEVSVTIDTNMMQKFSVVTNEHHLTHFACTTTDLDKGTLLAITQKIRSLRPAGSGRILYMCRNGAEYSGLVCVLSLLLDRMDNDYHLTVPLVVGAIKAIRPQVIPTLDQYKLLYEALQLYSESFSEYTNLGGSVNKL